MSIVSKITRAIFPAREKRTITVVAKYDAAQTTAENAAHWSQATAWDADTEASSDVRATLRSRSRYETANNPWIAGMVKTQAYDIIGTGPRLQVLSDKSKLNNAIEADFAAWARAIHLAQKLHTMRMAQARDGEAFAVLITNNKLTTKIKLDLQLIEADCIRADYNGEPTATEVDGISYDAAGNPKRYNVMPHPGGLDTGARGISVPADRVIHLYNADRPGQHRGVPELTSALPYIAILRRYTLAMVKKMETSANISGVIQTEEIDQEDGLAEAKPFENFSLPRDAFAALPRGYRLQSHQLNNPTESQTEFALQVKLEVARALSLPRNVALGDSSGYNYASGRLDYQAYDKHLAIERLRIETIALSSIMDHWLREFWPQSIYRKTDIPMTWFWDGRAHVDPVKEANAEAQRLATGTTTLAIECARQGLDWEVVQDQRLAEELREMQRRKELGLPDAKNQPAKPESPPEPEDE